MLTQNPFYRNSHCSLYKVGVILCRYLVMMMMMVFIDTLSVHHCLHTLLLFLYLAALAVRKFLSPLLLHLGPCSPFALFLLPRRCRSRCPHHPRSTLDRARADEGLFFKITGTKAFIKIRVINRDNLKTLRVATATDTSDVTTLSGFDPDLFSAFSTPRLDRLGN